LAILLPAMFAQVAALIGNKVGEGKPKRGEECRPNPSSALEKPE
jgi:hypothetical protein